MIDALDRRWSGALASAPPIALAAAPVVLAGLITALAWPIAFVPALPGLDRSFHVALHLAAAAELRQGVDFVYTYGPLGFLGFPIPYLGATSTLALIASIGVYFGLIGTVLVEARRAWPLPIAAIVTLLLARMLVFLPTFEALEILAFLWSVEAVAGRIRIPTTGVLIAAGLLAGAATLGKVNVGLFVVALGGVTALTIGRPWWRGAIIFTATAAATLIVLWLALGQRLGDLPAYVAASYQMIAGYEQAMGLDPAGNRAWVLMGVVALIGLLLCLGFWSSRDWSTRKRLGLAALGLVMSFSLWKLVTVREHGTFAFGTAAFMAFAFSAPPLDRRVWLASVLACALALTGSASPVPAAYLDMPSSAGSLVTEANDAFRPDHVELAAARTRDELRSAYRLPGPIMAALAGHSIHIDPFETAVAYAYPEFRWAPLPVFQPFAAYTSVLDEMNAQRLRSADAPERILRRFATTVDSDRLRAQIGRPVHEGEVFPFTVDFRFRWFESPAAMLETFCRYTQVAQSGAWQVLARTAASCGSPEPLATVTARPGEKVQVPVEHRADRFVIVKVAGLEPSLLGRVKEVLLKAPDWYVTVDGTRYRFVPGTAGDGLPLAVPPAADGTGPFAFGPPIQTIAITRGLTRRVSGSPLTYTFMSVPMGRP